MLECHFCVRVSFLCWSVISMLECHFFVWMLSLSLYILATHSNSSSIIQKTNSRDAHLPVTEAADHAGSADIVPAEIDDDSGASALDSETAFTGMLNI